MEAVQRRHEALATEERDHRGAEEDPDGGDLDEREEHGARSALERLEQVRVTVRARARVSVRVRFRVRVRVTLSR